jgi:hypothetical protein
VIVNSKAGQGFPGPVVVDWAANCARLGKACFCRWLGSVKNCIAIERWLPKETPRSIKKDLPPEGQYFGLIPHRADRFGALKLTQSFAI